MLINILNIAAKVIYLADSIERFAMHSFGFLTIKEMAMKYALRM